MERPLVFLFPGQNSRYPAMLEPFAADPDLRVWLERASAVLGRDVVNHYRPDNAAVFARNRDVQVGVFLANHLHWQRLERAGVRAAFSAGLSLGEFNHLVHIGALDFDDALRLLEARGAAYECGPTGRMVAVFPVDVDDVVALVGASGLADRVGVAMINTPRQAVLSGEREAVEAVAAQIADAFGGEAVLIEPEIPMHSPIFRAVGEALRPALAQVRWRPPRLPYVSNVDGTIEASPSPADFADALRRHVYSTVRWRDCIDVLAGAAGDATFVETGPRTVLTGLFGRKWRSPSRLATDAADSAPRLARLIQEGPDGLRPAAGAY